MSKIKSIDRICALVLVVAVTSFSAAADPNDAAKDSRDHGDQPSVRETADGRGSDLRCPTGLVGGDFAYKGLVKLSHDKEIGFEYRPDLFGRVQKIWDRSGGAPSALNLADYVVFHGAAPYSNSVFALIEPKRPCPTAGCKTFLVIHSFSDKSLYYLTFYDQDSIATWRLPHLVIDNCVVTGVAFDPGANAKRPIESDSNGSGALESVRKDLGGETRAYWAKHEEGSD